MALDPAVFISSTVEDLKEHREQAGRAVQASGVSRADFPQVVLAREAMAPESAKRRAGQELADACGRVRGLLTGEDIEILFSRSRSQSHPLDFS